MNLKTKILKEMDRGTSIKYMHSELGFPLNEIYAELVQMEREGLVSLIGLEFDAAKKPTMAGAKMTTKGRLYMETYE